MSWRIVYIENSNYINCYLDNLKITKENEQFTIPFSDINSIIVDNNQTTLTVALINKCVEYKINLVICDIVHNPSSIFVPYTANYQSALIINRQLEWLEKSKANIWKQIVRSKIINQNKVLKLMKKEEYYINILDSFINSVEDYDKTNREGLAAKIYFRTLFGENFTRGDENIYNTCLNYGYSIIRSQICRNLVARGLNPHLGIFHKGPNNAFNLADDILEVFRPIVDLWVSKNISDEMIFNREIRLDLINLTTKYINYDKKTTIINAINILINKVIQYFENGNEEELSFPDIDFYEWIYEIDFVLWFTYNIRKR